MSFGQYKIQGTASQNVGYSSYVALVSQAGTNAPTAVILSNTLSGTPTWGYSGLGAYTLTLTGAWILDKTAINVTQSDQTAIFTGNRVNANQINIDTTDTSTQVADNGYLNKTMIEIRVYP